MALLRIATNFILEIRTRKVSRWIFYRRVGWGTNRSASTFSSAPTRFFGIVRLLVVALLEHSVKHEFAEVDFQNYF